MSKADNLYCAIWTRDREQQNQLQFDKMQVIYPLTEKKKINVAWGSASDSPDSWTFDLLMQFFITLNVDFLKSRFW